MGVFLNGLVYPVQRCRHSFTWVTISGHLRAKSNWFWNDYIIKQKRKEITRSEFTIYFLLLHRQVNCTQKKRSEVKFVFLSVWMGVDEKKEKDLEGHSTQGNGRLLQIFRNHFLLSLPKLNFESFCI